MHAVWPETVVEDSNLTVQISALRRILDEGRSEGSCIQTIPGRGYRFVGRVTWTEPESYLSTKAALDARGDAVGAENPRSPAIVVPIGRRRGPWLSIAVIFIALCLVGAASTLIAASHYGWFSKQAVSLPRLSIVVLPFANLSDDKEQQYFADGITEDLTTDLSRIAGSFVISRNTAFTYKDKPVSAKRVGRELGVSYVLEGSVQRSAQRVRIGVQLIDAESDAHVWAERFERDTTDLFALQNEITSQIAIALNRAIVGAEAARPTDNPDAQDYIFRGRDAMMKSSRGSAAEAIDLFERALALDTHSSEAQSYLAITLMNHVLAGLVDSSEADIARAEALAGQTLAASPHSQVAHYAKGQLLRAQGRYAEAITEYETVIALNRNFGAQFALGIAKLHAGSIEETIPLEEQVIRLSPHDPFIGVVYAQIGRVHLLQSRNDEAIAWLEKARGANPGVQFLHVWLAAAYGLQGETERATAELAEARRLRGGNQSIASMRAGIRTGAPKFRELVEATLIPGLRKAGMPEN